MCLIFKIPPGRGYQYPTFAEKLNLKLLKVLPQNVPIQEIHHDLNTNNEESELELQKIILTKNNKEEKNTNYNLRKIPVYRKQKFNNQYYRNLYRKTAYSSQKIRLEKYKDFEKIKMMLNKRKFV
jgi:hypothetical protein